MNRALLAVVACLICAPAAFADTHYVSKTGSNTPPYTSWATATDSVKLAVEAAAEWDTVRVGPGVYVEDSILIKTGMVLLGAGADSTALRDTFPSTFVRDFVHMGDSSTVVSLNLSGIGHDAAISFRMGIGGAARGCRIRGFQYGVYATQIYSNDPNNVVTVEACTIDSCIYPIVAENGYVEIRNNWIQPYFSLAAIDCGAAAPTIEGNTVAASVLAAEDGSVRERPGMALAVTCINLWHCAPFTVRNNRLSNLGTGIRIDNQSQNEFSLPWGRIENNTIYGQAGSGIEVTQTKVVVVNNIVVRCGMWEPVLHSTVDSVFFRYNLIWDYELEPVWDTTLAAFNLHAEPMFEDSVSYRPQMFSPAIDAGDPSILDPDGSRSDIGYTGGPGGFTYAYQDLPPAAPYGLTATPTDSQIAVLWRFNHEADFSHYSLYRDTLPIAAPDPTLLLTTGADSTYTDTAITARQTYYYRLTATDNQSNTSALSDEFAVIAVRVGDGPVRPGQLILHQNYPNPFNAATRIEYTLDQPAEVHLAIHDLLGRRVETLASGRQPAGTHHLTWNAESRASGMYFVVLEVSGTRRVRKALLLK